MNVFHTMAGAIVLAAGCFTLARGADKVLVPGDPPLTQETVDFYREMWEWYCEIKLTPAERQKHTQLFITFWKKNPSTVTKPLLDGYSRMEKVWRGDLEMKGVEQARRRAEMRNRWMTTLRKAADDPPGRVLVRAYDDAYKPGGTKNPILLPGDPRVTKSALDIEMAVWEMVLDLSFTDEERDECRRLFLEKWKTKTEAERQKYTKTLDTWAYLPTANDYVRAEKRALLQLRYVENLRKEPTSASAQWLLKLYEAAYKPGSTRNPVLVDVEPPLTQQTVERYTDYLAIMLDLSVSGGFNAEQRRMLHSYLLKGWKTMTVEARTELLGELKDWLDEASKGLDEAMKSMSAHRPRLLARLQLADKDELSRWLLAVVSAERKKAELLSEMERKRHEAAMILIGNLKPSGSWRYNPVNGRLEWRP
jgi:hypothetical protein